MPPLEKETLQTMASGKIENSIAFVKVKREKRDTKGKSKTSEQIVYLPITDIARDSSLRHEAERLRPQDGSAGYYMDAGYITASTEGLAVSADPRAVLDVSVMPSSNELPAEREKTVRSIQKIAGRRVPVRGSSLPTRP